MEKRGVLNLVGNARHITVALLLIVKEIYQTLHNLVSERLISAFCILVNTVQEYDSEDDQ